MDKKDLQNPALYTNRELSWLLFNKRVLSEARDKQLLLFERLKFLSITASNLDEFFMVRIGSLVDMIHAEYTKKDIAGMSAKEQLDALMEETHKFAALQYSTYNRMLLPQLRANGLNFVEHHEQLTERQAQYVDEYFEEQDAEYRRAGCQKGRKGYGNRVRNRTGSVCFAESCADSGGEGGGHRGCGAAFGRDH